ncbi:MAG: hypothetical protein ABR887_00075 [Methanoregulaceae archaeon]|jgi:hypothetical protein
MSAIIQDETPSEIINPEQQEQMKRAVESTCELCFEYQSISLLEFHFLTTLRQNVPLSPKLIERNCIIVCQSCHRHIHELPVPEVRLKNIILKRSFTTRKEILKALGYKPKPYSPPDDIDPSQIFEGSFNTCPPNSYRLSG